jgi:hypothetical protein
MFKTFERKSPESIIPSPQGGLTNDKTIISSVLVYILGFMEFDIISVDSCLIFQFR